MGKKSIDLCYRYYSTEPDPRVRLEYCRIMQALLEEEAVELQRQLDGPNVPMETLASKLAKK